MGKGYFISFYKGGVLKSVFFFLILNSNLSQMSICLLCQW